MTVKINGSRAAEAERSNSAERASGSSNQGQGAPEAFMALLEQIMGAVDAGKLVDGMTASELGASRITAPAEKALETEKPVKTEQQIASENSTDEDMNYFEEELDLTEEDENAVKQKAASVTNEHQVIVEQVASEAAQVTEVQVDTAKPVEEVIEVETVAKAASEIVAPQATTSEMQVVQQAAEQTHEKRSIARNFEPLTTAVSRDQSGAKPDSQAGKQPFAQNAEPVLQETKSAADVTAEFKAAMNSNAKNAPVDAEAVKGRSEQAPRENTLPRFIQELQAEIRTNASTVAAQNASQTAIVNAQAFQGQQSLATPETLQGAGLQSIGQQVSELVGKGGLGAELGNKGQGNANGFGNDSTVAKSKSHHANREFTQLSTNQQEKIVERIKLMMQTAAHGRYNTTMVLRLNPEHLGAMTIKMVQRGDQVFARVSPENQEVEGMLRNRVQEIAQVLANTGIRAENVHVSIGHEVAEGDASQFSSFLASEHGERQESGFSESREQGFSERAGFGGNIFQEPAANNTTTAVDASGWVA